MLKDIYTYRLKSHSVINYSCVRIDGIDVDKYVLKINKSARLHYKKRLFLIA